MKVYIQNHISRDCSALKALAEKECECEVFTDTTGFYRMKNDEFMYRGLVDNYKRILTAIVKDNDPLPLIWQDDITPVDGWAEEIKPRYDKFKDKPTCFFVFKNETMDKYIGEDKPEFSTLPIYWLYAQFVYMPADFAKAFLEMWDSQPDGYVWEKCTTTASGRRIASEDHSVRMMKGYKMNVYHKVLASHPKDDSILGNNATGRRFYL